MSRARPTRTECSCPDRIKTYTVSRQTLSIWAASAGRTHFRSMIISSVCWWSGLGLPDGYLQLEATQRGGVELLLQQVPEAKTGKNRLHLDLRTPHLDPEVQRLKDLGAAVLTSTPLVEHDWQWHVLTDPDGNEFCVLQPPPGFPWPTKTADALSLRLDR